jgi:hypothetical protein
MISSFSPTHMKKLCCASLEEGHIVDFCGLTLDLDNGAGTSDLDLLASKNVLELGLEVGLTNSEGLEELLAPCDLAVLVDDVRHGAGHHAEVRHVAEHLSGGLLVVEVDVRDGEALNLLGVLLEDGLAEELLELLLLSVVGDRDEGDLRQLLGELGELLVDAVRTLVEGVEEVQHVDLSGLEVDLIAADGLKELEARAGLSDGLLVRVGGHVDVSHGC